MTQELEREHVSEGNIPLIIHSQVNNKGNISISEQSLLNDLSLRSCTFPYFVHLDLKLAQKPTGFTGATGIFPTIISMVSFVLFEKRPLERTRGNSTYRNTLDWYCLFLKHHERSCSCCCQGSCYVPFLRCCFQPEVLHSDV